jgi:hypothetical protein
LEVDIYSEGREPFGTALQQWVKLKMADSAGKGGEIRAGYYDWIG